MKKLSFAIVLALLFPNAEVNAEDNYSISDPQGKSIFQVRIFNKGEHPAPTSINPEVRAIQSTWTLPSGQRDQILDAIRYWTEIIQPAPGHVPANIDIWTMDQINAAAASARADDSPLSQTKLHAALNGQAQAHSDPDVLIKIGKLDFTLQPVLPSQLPSIEKVDLTTTLRHEMAHALGISMRVTANENYQPHFDNKNTNWVTHLRDDNGNPARPGQAIICGVCNNPDDPKGFNLYKDQGYFAGEHVNEVLAGAMPGVPIKMNLSDGFPDSDILSHLELKNSMMSHQDYRNYTTFMEAEFAVLQDLGYRIDRRNFFGFSVYGDGQTLVNRNGYFARNPEGSAYLPGQYNTATLGLGLHLYGSHNQLSQQADLLTRGAGAAGIRVDGEGNTVSIEPGVRVHADGLNGRGVMFAYGKEHNLIQRGDVEALGEHGVALSFDFGHNVNGDAMEYRGSYIYRIDNGSIKKPLLPELAGALANNVDISGRVAGREAAIFVSDNALVGNINIMQGARLQGDIVSLYDQKDETGQQRLTRLSFGRLADDTGRATDAADPMFRFRHDGNIHGPANLVLSTRGGTTSLNGKIEVHSVQVGAGSTLAGNGNYVLDKTSSFVNDGTLAPGNASIERIELQGNYRQGAQGRLLLAVNETGQHNSLAVNGNAELSGRLSFTPLPGWYANGWTTDIDTPISVTGQTTGAFDTVDSQSASPTLALKAAQQGNGRYRLTMTRANDAYGRYGADDNARAAGQALDRAVTAAGPDIQPLYRALDFSASDGSQIARALNQLSPAGYSALFAGSLQRERQLNTLLGARNGADAPTQPFADGWTAFAVPFGGSARQQRQDGVVGYASSTQGVLFGAEKSLAGNGVFGFHGAVTDQTVNVRAPESGSGKTTAFELGVHARYADDPRQGRYVFGSARLGTEQASMDRSLSFGGYPTKNRADWNGLIGTLAAGGGYRWALNRNLQLGMLAEMNYTTLSRPALTERGDGSRLALDAARTQSLRSGLGFEGTLDLQPESATGLQANLQLIWEHELLNTALVQNASLADYANTRFSSKNALSSGRDALNVRTGVHYRPKKELELGLALSTDLLRPGYDSLSGNLSASWRF
jgi:subtilase-type serine protease